MQNYLVDELGHRTEQKIELSIFCLSNFEPVQVRTDQENKVIGCCNQYNYVQKRKCICRSQKECLLGQKLIGKQFTKRRPVPKNIEPTQKNKTSTLQQKTTLLNVMFGGIQK